MPAQDLVHGPFSYSDLERPFIRKGEYIVYVARPRSNWSRNQRASWVKDGNISPSRGTGTIGGPDAGSRGTDPPGQLCNRRRLEHLAQRQVGADAAGIRETTCVARSE